MVEMLMSMFFSLLGELGHVSTDFHGMLEGELGGHLLWPERWCCRSSARADVPLWRSGGKNS
jgi:sorbitol-specific phosphotransferase system component IIA